MLPPYDSEHLHHYSSCQFLLSSKRHLLLTVEGSLTPLALCLVVLLVQDPPCVLDGQSLAPRDSIVALTPTTTGLFLASVELARRWFNCTATEYIQYLLIYLLTQQALIHRLNPTPSHNTCLPQTITESKRVTAQNPHP